MKERLNMLMNLGFAEGLMKKLASEKNVSSSARLLINIFVDRDNR